MAAIENQLDFYNVSIDTQTIYGKAKYLKTNTYQFSQNTALNLGTVGALNTNIILDFELEERSSINPDAYGNPLFQVTNRDNNQLKYCQFWIKPSTGKLFYGNDTMLAVEGGVVSLARHILMFNWNSFYLDDELVGTVSSSYADGLPFNLQIGSDYRLAFKYFKVLVYQNDVLVNDWEPSYNNGYYLYDIIGEQYSENTGSFTGEREEIERKISSYTLDSTLDNSNLESLKSTETISVLGDELVYDTMEIEARQSFDFAKKATQIIFNANGGILNLSDWQVTNDIDFKISFSMDLDYINEQQIVFSIPRLFNLYYIPSLNSFRLQYFTGVSGTAFYVFEIPLDGYIHSLRLSVSNDVCTITVDNTSLDSFNVYFKSSASSSIVIGAISTSATSNRFYGKIDKIEVRRTSTSSLIYNLFPFCDEDNVYCFTNEDKTVMYYSANSNNFDADYTIVKDYNDPLKAYNYGTLINHYSDSLLCGKFYVEDSERVGKNKYHYNCFSSVGLLDRQYYNGNMFNGETFKSVIDEILLDYQFNYTVDTSVTNVHVYGWIPYCTKRDALRQLLFATNVHIFKDENQNIVFKYLSTKSSIEIPNSRIFDNGSEEFVKLATKVNLCEHGFAITGNEAEAVLFDNTNNVEVNKMFITFQSAPIIVNSIVTSGNLSFEQVTVNTAIVSGQGVLRGKPYTHLTRNVFRESNDNNRAEYEVTVTDATLITAANSDSVLDRLSDYYFNRHISRFDIIMNEEQCGLSYIFMDAFGTEQFGILHKMEKVYSSFVRASCEFICGLSIIDTDNNYEHYVVIDSNSSWQPPTGTTKVKLTIIGGGSGGNSGKKGKDGYNHNGGEGGIFGEGGKPGRVKIVTLELVPGSTSLSITIGNGGSGGATCNSETTSNLGTIGGNTIVSYNGQTFSSYDGDIFTSGILNVFDGIIYAKQGGNGVKGGNGGNGGTLLSLQYEDPSIANGKKGENVLFNQSIFSGGNGGRYDQVFGGQIATGAGGGGACGNAHGYNGTDGYSVQESTYVNYTYGGVGGNGATPSKRVISNYGSGGDGGHGGGGGGGNGSGLNADYYYDRTPTANGIGGNGGAGGDGAPGCVLIYY